MAEPQEQPASVVALSVISLVFGIIGMLGSFIPCLGVFALFVAVPAALCGGAAFMIASKTRTSKGLAVAATTISLIGVVIAGLQYMALAGTGKALNDAAQEAAKQQQKQLQQQKETPPPANP